MSIENSIKEFQDSMSAFSETFIRWMRPQMEIMREVLEEISKLPSYRALINTIGCISEERGIDSDSLIKELGTAKKLWEDFQSRYEWQLSLIDFAEKLERKRNGSNDLG